MPTDNRDKITELQNAIYQLQLEDIRNRIIEEAQPDWLSEAGRNPVAFKPDKHGMIVTLFRGGSADHSAALTYADTVSLRDYLNTKITE